MISNVGSLELVFTSSVSYQNRTDGIFAFWRMHSAPCWEKRKLINKVIKLDKIRLPKIVILLLVSQFTYITI